MLPLFARSSPACSDLGFAQVGYSPRHIHSEASVSSCCPRFVAHAVAGTRELYAERPLL